MVVYNRYPSDPRVRRAAEALVRRGYQVHVICTSEEGCPDEDIFNNVRIYRVRVPKVSGAKWSNALAMLLFMWHSFLRVNTIHRRFCPAYYHVHSLPDFLVGVCLWPKIRGAKIILDLHESFPEIVLARFRTTSKFLYFVAEWLERFSCFFSDHIIVVNDTIKKLVVERGENSSRITVIMNSPMLTSANDQEVKAHHEVAQAQSLGLPIFVYAGGINAERDLATLVKAVELLKIRNVHLHVLFFTHTETAYIQVIKEQIKAANLENQMKFCGVLPAEAVLASVRHSDVGIVSYERSPLTEVALPNKVFEFMEAEVPIVSANLPTLRDLLGGCAIYYEPGNNESLAEAISLSLNDPMKTDRIKNAKKIYQSCSWTVMENRLLNIYEYLNGNDIYKITDGVAR